jgi:nucleoside-diphosphate-sugar epimerase
MKVIVLGGAGYSGSVLVRELLARGDEVVVVDTFWFGDWLEDRDNLRKITCDIRDTNLLPQESFDAVVHLANIANDPGVELSPVLSWEVNVLATQRVAEWAVAQGIPHFIYASSGSVYGVKDEDKVTEDLSLVPISAYNKTKMVAERVLMSYQDHFRLHIVRPATICGVSPRMRFDLTVNLLTLQAVTAGRITVFGGDQVRPNIHVDDIARVYLHFLDQPSIQSGLYNAGFENMSVLQIAELITEKVRVEITVTASDDPRSYRLDSTKILETGFAVQKNVQAAIQDVLELAGSGFDVGRKEWMTVARLKELGLTEDGIQTSRSRSGRG